MSEELNPCPFCKHDALIVTDIHHRHGTKIYHGECNVCGAESKACDSKEEAIKAWNTRPTEDALKAEMERLKKQISELEEIVREYADRHALSGCDDSVYFVARIAEYFSRERR